MGDREDGGLHPRAARVVRQARGRGVELAVTRFPQGTRTAADAAVAVGCPLGAIVKSLVLSSDQGPVLVLTSGANRVAMTKIAAALGRTGLRRAGADEAREATGCPIGGTAPFGHATDLPVLCDEDLLGYAEVWAAAGTPDTVFPVAPDTLVALAAAQVADVAERSKP